MQNPSKIIFFDFDGPLSNVLVVLAYGEEAYMDPVTVHALNHVCEASGAKIVCTSTRAVISPENYKTTLWRFQQAGLDISHIHHDWSCNTGNEENRYDHIQDWLKRHPEVTHYAIVDDDTVMDGQGRAHPKMVKVGMHNGMLFAHFQRLARLLDFDLIDAFNKSSEGSFQPGQFILPFDDWEATHNAEMLMRNISEAENRSKDWDVFPVSYWRPVNYEDSRMRIQFHYESGLKGTLTTAFDNIRKGKDNTLFLRNGVHIFIQPQPG